MVAKRRFTPERKPPLRRGGAEVKREAENAGDAVRILTAHGAKGLQAPVVIIPDVGRGGRNSPLRWEEVERGAAGEESLIFDCVEVLDRVTGLLVGVVVGIIQAATQINEATLSFIPKLVGVFVTLVVAGPWMLSVMLDYMRQVFTGIPGLIG